MFSAASNSLCSKPQVSDNDKKTFLRVFQLCDEGNKGYLSREDLKVAVVMLFGYKPSKLEVDSMLSSFMINTTGVTSDNFLKMMALKKAAQLSFGNQREIFSVFDVHCRGFLTLEDFKRAFRQVAPHLSERTVVEAFREVDQDSDGLVSYKDFEFVLNYGEDDQ
ncbi:hypothetical protein XENTR_v10021584 [Xenopus tropicalis]|uniref:EF-hand calcium-binding domain-containing protein 11 n=1 Tax=Xenopus tropicalis TaxID=8364 RepID=A9JR69_XENTR|nr:EF-hand calcium-binding domain-containing protein 11 [Xenopus tropicalis]AAI55538.1 LOC100135073 protein [Xenopus tropicalis]KAE8586188.1 hypothetical protein XENTR_v10021584 [Xenopus tropicalis]|eukprot:NP_001107284.1 EF-hand calcium-binding domain-containing protein 11 [Xenopus tropicalis]